MHAALPYEDSVEIGAPRRAGERRATHAADVNRELLAFLGVQPATVGVAA